MLTSRLTDCTDCIDSLALIGEIDCKITDLAKCTYNKIIYGLNTGCSLETFSDLINYRRILTNKYYNPEYASKFPITTIASRIKILLNK